MIRVPLSQGFCALIDGVDAPLILLHKWCAMKVDDRMYAVRNEQTIKGKRLVLMHRLIMAAPKGTMVDHWDHDGLNNQRKNLRLASHAENMRNRQKHCRSTTSRYKGVCWYRDRRYPGPGKWKVAIKAGDIVRSAYAKSEEEAARIYDRLARKYHGPFALLNFP